MKQTQILHEEYTTPTTISTYLDSGDQQTQTSSDGCQIINFFEVKPELVRAKASGFMSISDLVDRYTADTDNGGELLAQARQQVAQDFYSDHHTLSAYRLKAGLSQRDLANTIGSTQSYIARLEAGKSDPGRKIMLKLCHALDVDMNTLSEALP